MFTFLLELGQFIALLSLFDLLGKMVKVVII